MSFQAVDKARVLQAVDKAAPSIGFDLYAWVSEGPRNR